MNRLTTKGAGDYRNLLIRKIRHYAQPFYGLLPVFHKKAKIAPNKIKITGMKKLLFHAHLIPVSLK